MRVSIVITTKNEEANIGNCLRSIKAQGYPQDKTEIIVVDNNSTDKTKEITRSFCHSEHIHGVYTERANVFRKLCEESRIQLYNRGHERSAQRNFGMMNIAKGKYVMFVDADSSLLPSLFSVSRKNTLLAFTDSDSIHFHFHENGLLWKSSIHMTSFSKRLFQYEKT